jgi:hypothetical protein
MNTVQMGQDFGLRILRSGFESGEYNPSTPEGKKLITHEIGHLKQPGSKIRRKASDDNYRAKIAALPERLAAIREEQARQAAIQREKERKAAQKRSRKLSSETHHPKRKVKLFH